MVELLLQLLALEPSALSKLLVTGFICTFKLGRRVLFYLALWFHLCCYSKILRREQHRAGCGVLALPLNPAWERQKLAGVGTGEHGSLVAWILGDEEWWSKALLIPLSALVDLNKMVFMAT